MFLNYYIVFSVFICLVFSKNCTIDHNSASNWFVNCSSLNLSTLPEHLSIYPIRNLTIINNNLNSTIKFGKFNNLEHLNVAFNKLTYITNETFHGLNRLLYLNISFNQIQILNGDVFNNLQYLKVLDLSGNIELSNDVKFLEIPLGAALYRGLRRLYLTNLNLNYLNDNIFDRANELFLLDLSNNNLTDLPILPKILNIINFSNNSFNKLSSKPFYYSRNITTIVAENNLNLNLIESDTFQTIHELQIVSLKGCKQLNNIGYETFYFNKKLRFLSIASCNFKTLPVKMKHIIFNIHTVDLQDNPWHCTPAIKWILLMNIPKDLTNNLRCSTPHEAPLLEYYGPQRHHEILKIILGTLVVLVFIFFGIGLFYAYRMENVRKMAHPYMPLGRNGPPIPNPIYISTVV